MEAKDLSGQKFGRLTVLERVPSFITPSGKKQVAWKVICDCGSEKVVRGCDLKSGKTVSCGCYNKEKDLGKKQYIDLSGKRFGRLIVDEYAYTKNNIPYFECTCDCGNTGIYNGKYLRSGDVKSCGCQRIDNASMHMAKDLSNQRFGRLIALYVASRKPRRWHCICDCGNEVDVLTNQLISGHTQSCGCLHKEITSEMNRKDITGKQFGFLTALYPMIDDHVKNECYKWKCKCVCGRECIIRTGDLICGNTKSCGCMISGVEEYIAKYLDNNNIKYIRQKTFIGCKDIGKLKFDFYIPDRNIAIEYDGEMHYIETSLHNDVEQQQRRDAIKDQYCEENEIILLRIPYWGKDNIESILNDWLFLYDTEEANSSDVDLSA